MTGIALLIEEEKLANFKVRSDYGCHFDEKTLASEMLVVKITTEGWKDEREIVILVGEKKKSC